MRRTRPKPAPMWRARVTSHRVERWIVPACQVEIPAVSAENACELVVLESHRRAKVPLPPWRPFIRQSLPHASAEPLEGSAA
jgi:hypothetical protein